MIIYMIWNATLNPTIFFIYFFLNFHSFTHAALVPFSSIILSRASIPSSSNIYTSTRRRSAGRQQPTPLKLFFYFAEVAPPKVGHPSLSSACSFHSSLTSLHDIYIYSLNDNKISLNCWSTLMYFSGTVLWLMKISLKIVLTNGTSVSDF